MKAIKKKINIFLGFVFVRIEKIKNKMVNSYQTFIFHKQIENIGSKCHFNGQMKITGHSNIQMENNVHIGDGAYIRGEGGVYIGDNVHISRNLVLYSHNHNYEGEVLPYDNTFQFNKVTIEKNVWIGMNVVILPGSYIGEGAIIGAGSVVYGNVPKLAIVGSAGYKILKYRDSDHYNELEQNKKYGGIDGRPINS